MTAPRVGSIGIGSSRTLDPGVEQLVEDSRAAQTDAPGPREAWTELIVGAAFLLAAGAMAVAIPWEPPFDLATTLLLVVLYAAVSRLWLDDGHGYTVPTQVIFVPMLFFLPAPLVPLAVAAGCLLGSLPDFIAGRRHPLRAVFSLGDSWHAVGPALVFALGSAGTPDLADWQLLAAALGAQFAFDFAASTIREWAALGISPRTQPRLLAWVYLTDACLAPLGFFGALIAVDNPFGLVLLAPVAVLLATYVTERRERVDGALELSTAYRGTAHLLGELIEADDDYTGSHTRGVVELSLLVSDHLGVDPAVRREVEFTALLHDVGKIAIPNEIINKPGALDDEEWALMRTHTLVGQEMLDRVGGMLGDVGLSVRASHERYDGRGYPDGLAGENIPLAARVVACCDAFNAMTTARSYRMAMSTDVAIQEVAANTGTQFDPEVARALIFLVATGASQDAEPLPRLLHGLHDEPHGRPGSRASGRSPHAAPSATS